MSLLSVIGSGVSSFFGLKYQEHEISLADSNLRNQISFLQKTFHKLQMHFNKKEYDKLKVCARGVENSVKQLKNQRYNIYYQHIQEDMESLIVEIDLFKANKIKETELRIFISRLISITESNIKNLQ